MDPPTIVNKFKYTSQQPMFNVLEPPLHYTSSSLHQTNPTNFQDISFSSYLKAKDPSQKPHQNDAADDTEISIFDAQKYFSENSDVRKQGRMSNDDHANNNNSVQRASSVSSVEGYGRNFRTRSFHATPTVSSEASWNSQTGLLTNPPGSAGVNLRNLSGGKQRNSVSRKWIFGRKCCCNGKKSVQVKEAVTSDSEHGGPVIPDMSLYAKRESYKAKALPNMSSIMETHQQKVMAPSPVRLSPPENEFPAAVPPRQQRISASGRTFVDGTGGFSFPILNSTSTSTSKLKPVSKELMIVKPIISPIEDPPRDSLEVFQPTKHERISRPNFGGGAGSPIARAANTDDDAVSDASSDLFEIESFSTQTTSYPMYRRRDSLDEGPTFNTRRFASANGLTLNTSNSSSSNNNSIQYGRRSLDEPPTPSIAATECYAPSEVSIDWSVTTAEGFDRASVSNFSVSASEVGTAAFLRQRLQQQQEEFVDSGRRKGNMLLMSCRQEKAVSVGPQPVKCVIPAEGPVHVGGKPPRAGKAVGLGGDHSTRLSLAFAA